jgi:hypothetical protein
MFLWKSNAIFPFPHCKDFGIQNYNFCDGYFRYILHNISVFLNDSIDAGWLPKGHIAAFLGLPIS